MQPVSPWLACCHSMPLTQMSIEPGYVPVSLQAEGWLSVEYCPTTWYQRLAWMLAPQSVCCQKAPEPRLPSGLKAYAERRLQRFSEFVMLYMRASHSQVGAYSSHLPIQST